LTESDDRANPLLAPWTDPMEAPPFDRVKAEHFPPAFEATIAEHRAELAAISGNPAEPDFDNVLAALERSGARLARVRRVFWTLSSAQADGAIRAIEGGISTMLARHSSATGHDQALFARVAAMWAKREALGPEQRRLSEQSYKGFVRGGAALAEAARRELASIDERLAALSTAFGHNLLAATGEWEMALDAADLAGLPQSLVESAGTRAERKGRKGKFLFTLDRSDVEPFLAFAERRDLREHVWRAFTGRCDGGPHDNKPLISEIVRLRARSARLLGYPTFADYRLEDSMAGAPEAAEGLLKRVWAPARLRAIREGEALQALIDADGGGFQLAPWDWRFYAERRRRESDELDAAAIRSHLKLEKVREAAFDTAGRLYGLRFHAREDVPVYHPDVRAWEVRDPQGGAIGLLYTDYFARPEKHGGAWMGSLRVQERMDGIVLPIVYTVANFAKAPDPSQSLLSMDEARTLFHEFGHALHALLSDVTYPSLSGTSVVRDFVEFPSKFMEHWVVAPERLKSFGMEPALIEAINRAEGSGRGFETVEFVAAAILDLALHRQEEVEDVAEFERQVLEAIGLPPAIRPRYGLAQFGHIFDGGYASGYYSYLWSEILDEDAFAAFVERGDLFDPELAARFRREVLARGDSRDPMASFVAFRGRGPEEGPLLRARGLA
jgi:peptidyl-dipeptidase Dcp